MMPSSPPKPRRLPPTRTRSPLGSRRLHALGLVALLSLAVGCQTVEPNTVEGITASPLPACCRKELPSATPSESSLYLLENRWTSDLGRNLALGHFRGRLVVLTMFFSTCEFACPLLVQDLKRLEAALPSSIRDQVDFVLVSFDTERDTPEALAAYRARQSLDPTRWCLLTGHPDDVRDLAAILGIRYAKDARGQFMHSNVLTLLDRNGEVSHQEMGLNRPLESLLGAMEASAMNTALPTPPDHRAQ